MKHPNFFIIGAHKCGTTSVAAWLSEHPSVFVCPVKEPQFLSMDLPEHHQYTYEGYLQLFDAATDQHSIVCDASTNYLYSEIAINKVHEFSPDARFAIFLRDPAKMAVSLHGQRCNDGSETETDFERAWQLQEKRRDGQDVPWSCPTAKRLLYGDICSIGTQVERVLRQVPRERVFIRTLDDIRQRPGIVYRELLAFLDLPDDGRTDFPALNQGRQLPRWVVLSQLFLSQTKKRMGMRGGVGIISMLNRRFAQQGRPEVSEEMKRELDRYFRREVEKLESILDRDLSNWKITGDP